MSDLIKNCNAGTAICGQVYVKTWLSSATRAYTPGDKVYIQPINPEVPDFYLQGPRCDYCEISRDGREWIVTQKANLTEDKAEALLTVDDG